MAINIEQGILYTKAGISKFSQYSTYMTSSLMQSFSTHVWGLVQQNSTVKEFQKSHCLHACYFHGAISSVKGNTIFYIEKERNRYLDLYLGEG